MVDGLCRAGGVFSHSSTVIPDVPCCVDKTASARINSESLTVA
nr:hypothetical protein [Burkholderia vietnamiensis]